MATDIVEIEVDVGIGWRSLKVERGVKEFAVAKRRAADGGLSEKVTRSCKAEPGGIYNTGLT